jgi:HPt (histidine-containing phosphotransfer) domain-containing protein
MAANLDAISGRKAARIDRPRELRASGWKASGPLAEFETEKEWSILRDLIGTFLDDGAARLQALRAAASAHDFETLFRQSHALKGSALAVGALPVAELSASLERFAKSGVNRDYLLCIDQLEGTFKETRLSMIAYCDCLPDGSSLWRQ